MYNTTILEQETVDLSALDGFGATGTENVITPETLDTTPNPLANTDPEKALDAAPIEKKVVEPVIAKAQIESILDATNTELEPEVTEEATAATKEADKGRPKTDKNALVSYLAQKVETNEFGIPEDAAFDAKKQTIVEYLGTLPEKELHNLLDSNWKAKEDELKAQTPKDFFESLPEELQYAAAYVAEGGQDLKALFKALSYVEEVKALDPEKDTDQVAIVRSYLQAKGFGTEETIAEQIEEWKESEKIAKKAREFKPALDDMQKQQVEAQIKVAEKQKKEQQELARFYADNVYKALETNEIAGVKIDKKFANTIANGLVTTQAGPWSGRPVNSLGYGLEKVQYTEPDYEALVLASWLLNDKKGFLEAMQVQGGNKAVEKASKLIKLAQGLGVSDIPIQEQKPAVKRIPNNSNALRRPQTA